MSEELLPCPFCGGAPCPDIQQVNHAPKTNTTWFAAWCEGCKSSGPERTDKAEAITAWNTRAGIPDPAAYRAAFEAVVGALEKARKTMDGYRSQMKFCDVEALGYFREFDSRMETSGFRAALQAARIARGDA